MLILAGVTVSTLTGNNGLITKAIEAKEKSKMAAIKEQADLAKMEWLMEQKSNPNLTINDFWNKLIEQGIIDSIEDDVEEVEPGVYTIITKDGYEMEVIVDSSGNIQIGDIASGDELLHKIKVTATSTNSITVKATVGRKYTGAKLSYYYKQNDDADYTELDGKQNTSDLEATIPNLIHGKSYSIKVVAKSGKETAELETTATTGIVDGAVENLATGKIVASIGSWNTTARTTSMTLTTSTNHQIQWQQDDGTNQINDDNWKTVAKGVKSITIPDLELGDTIYARLWDGKNAGNYASATVSEDGKPSATVAVTTTNILPGGKVKATVTLSDSESGVKLNDCKWVYSKSQNELGITSGELTSGNGFTSESGEIEWTTTETTASGTYWLHVLTVDNAGNKLETVSKQSVLVGIVPTGTTADGTVTFDTSYGLIDIVWLSETGDTISEVPNSPAASLGGMTPVKWNTSMTESTTTSTDTDWYSYEAASGTADSKKSHWANAKNSDDSYFVWIPRYAYRIKYYSDDSYAEDKLTGYYDGYGMWRASDGKRKVKLEDDAKVVTSSNGDRYIVHPAFTDKVNLGGWSKQIRGFWTAKYEMSQETKSGSTWSPKGATNDGGGNVETSSTIRAVSKPYISSSSVVTSWRSITIGNMYTNSYNYDRNKESHLMKNSEWGAVAYLTQSKYGRNGHEVDINSCSSYYPGNGSGHVGNSENYSSSIQNLYNTTTGAGASTTGNIYGVYDMSGGVWEYVAGFDTASAHSNLTTFGKSTSGTVFASQGRASTQYATAYSNGTEKYDGNQTIFNVGKVGDATKEVNKGGAYARTDETRYYNWFDDYPNVVGSSFPFFGRGGYYNNGAIAGVFYSHGATGNTVSYGSFRVVLVP